MLGISLQWPFRRQPSPTAPGQRAVTWDDLASAGMLGNTTAAGISVTPENALASSPVYAAVRKITSAIGTLPFTLYRRESDDGRTKAVDHPVYRILHTSPNPTAVPFTFWSACVVQMLLYGKMVAEIERNLAGEPIALWLLPSNRVEYVGGGFEVRGSKQTITIADADVLHVPYFSVDGQTGKGIIEYARETLGASKAMEAGGAAFLANMVRPGGIIKVPAGFSDQARENLRKSIVAENGSARKTGRLMLLEDGTGFEPQAVSNTDAQWLEARSFSVVEVARFFNISPTKLADLSRATWGNIESENRSYIEDTLLPILTPIAQEVLRKLLTEEEQKTLYAEHVLEVRLRGNTTERYAAYASAINAGWLAPNEARLSENRDRRPGLDDPRAPLNMVPTNPDTPKPAPPAATPPEADSGNP